MKQVLLESRGTETIAPPFACLERSMGLGRNPCASDLIIVTVVLQYGV